MLTNVPWHWPTIWLLCQGLYRRCCFTCPASCASWILFARGSKEEIPRYISDGHTSWTRLSVAITKAHKRAVWFIQNTYMTLWPFLMSSLNVLYLAWHINHQVNYTHTLSDDITEVCRLWTIYTLSLASLFLNTPLIVWNSIMLIMAKVGSIQALCLSSLLCLIRVPLRIIILKSISFRPS